MIGFLTSAATGFLRKPGPGQRSRHGLLTVRPAVEALEPRVVPAVTYHGGALIASVNLEPVYFGNSWFSGTLNSQAQGLTRFYQYLADSSYMTMLEQYRVGAGQWQRSDFIGGTFPTNTTSDAAIQSMLEAEINAGGVSQPGANWLYVVFTPPGVTVPGRFQGYHDAFRDGQGRIIVYAVVTNPGGGAAIDFNTTTALSTHEIAEAVTDPLPRLGSPGWYDDNIGYPTQAESEIGDLCNGMLGTLNGFTVQYEWSVVDNRCILPTDRNVVASSLTSSNEYLTNLVAGFYQTFLHRPGSSLEVSNWVNSINQLHLTDERVIAGFLNSDEYFNDHAHDNPSFSPNENWVYAVYNDVLNRNPDTNGLNNWLSQLNAGTSRETVAFEIDTSQEAETDIVNSYYEHYLGRAGDANGVNGFVSLLLNHSQTREQVINDIVASNEYFDAHTSGFVDPSGSPTSSRTNESWLLSVYWSILGREADPSGYQHFLLELRAGGAG